MAYFEKFPLTGYDLVSENQSNIRIVTDIFLRARMLQSIQDQTLVYYEYDIVDGDTPEISIKIL